MLGRFHHLSRSASRARAESLLREYGLQDAADRLVTTYSGGMRRRLDLAASLVVDPPVLFLDEPTTGLDPTARLDLWEAVRSRKQSGTAVLLTTQYLDEADHLADEVVIIAHGRVVAQGSPEALKNTTGSRADILAAHADDLPRIVTALDRWTIGEAQLDPARRHVSLPIDAGSLTLPGLVRHLDDAGIDVHDAGIRRPTLNEVFLDRITAGLPATSADGGHAA